MPILLGIVTICGVAYVMDVQWLLSSVQIMLAVCGVLGGCLGLGWLMTRSLLWDVAGMIGLGIMGTLLLPISIMVGPKWGLLLLGVGWWQLWKMRWTWSIRLSYQGMLALLLGVLAVWNAQQVLIDTDSLYYHAALPKHMWLQNGLLGGELHPNGSRPLIWHLPLTMAYGLGGTEAVVLMSSWVAIAAWFSLGQMCERSVKGTGWWIWMLVLASYSLLEQTMVVANNMVVLWWVTLAYRERQRVWIWGALMGFAVVGKFTAVAVVGLIGCFTKRPLMIKIQAASVVLGLVAVWLLRNWAENLHPLFPYAGWDMNLQFLWVEKYGMGREWVDFALAPWNLLVHAEIDSFQFLGQLSPAFGLLGVWGVYGIFRHRRWRAGVILLGAFAWWFVGPHWIRHLFPMMGLFIVLSIEGLSIRLFHHVLFGLACLIGLPNNVSPFVQMQVDRVSGRLNPPGLAATNWLNEHATDGSAALFCLWTAAYLDHPYVLSSVEDHTPIRHWSLKYGVDAIPRLKEQGVRYVAFGPHTFYPSAYPFLSKAELQRDWIDPMMQMEDQLLEHGRWIVRLDGVNIYRLD